MSKPSLASLLSALAGDDDDAPELTHAQQIERLRAAAPRYARKNPFKVGDLVTPVAGGEIRHAGAPHIVIATQPGGFDARIGQAGTNAFGAVPDVRVLTFSQRGDIASYWTESSGFEPYVSPAPTA